MRAIVYSEANMDKIIHAQILTDDEVEYLKFFLPRNYVLIRGYVTPKGRFKQWAIVPRWIFDLTFDHDPDKITHDWDQIVRKS